MTAVWHGWLRAQAARSLGAGGAEALAAEREKPHGEALEQAALAAMQLLITALQREPAAVRRALPMLPHFEQACGLSPSREIWPKSGRSPSCEISPTLARSVPLGPCVPSQHLVYGMSVTFGAPACMVAFGAQ